MPFNVISVSMQRLQQALHAAEQVVQVMPAQIEAHILETHAILDCTDRSSENDHPDHMQVHACIHPTTMTHLTALPDTPARLQAHTRHKD